MRALLDINVLIALFDPTHQHHALATEWLKHNIKHGWASCPITQNGFVRIMTQPNYPRAITLQDAVSRLTDATATEHHQFWPDDISVLSPQLFRHDRMHGPRQVTDLYLIALAVHQQGRLVTFDQSISLSAVLGVTSKHIVVL